MRRSIRVFATSLAAFLLAIAVPAAPALAATAQIASPSQGDTVSQVVTIQVSASRDFLEGSITSVRVRLSANGSEPAAGTQIVDATCTSGCGSQNQIWTVQFDPVTFAPFGTPSAGRCNGGWWLQSNVNGGAFGQGVRVVRTVAPSAPSGVTATGGTEQASIRWTRAPEPDVVGYLVERRQDSGSWTTVANLGASADRYTDTVTAGTWSYRVVSLRGDGKTSGGDIAAPCTDTGADLAAASQVATTEVKPKSTSTSTTDGSTTDGSSTTTDGSSTTTDGSTTDGSSGGDGTTDGTTDGTDGDGTTDGTTTDGETTDGTDGTATDGGDTTGEQAPVRRAPPRQAAPPPVDTAPNFSGSLDVGSQDPQVAQERYFGDDDEFSEEWDFGDAEAIVGEDLEAGVETRTIRVPGALQTVLGEELDVMRLFGSIAAGLVMITFGMHLRRWMRAGMVD